MKCNNFTCDNHRTSQLLNDGNCKHGRIYLPTCEARKRYNLWNNWIMKYFKNSTITRKWKEIRNKYHGRK